MPITQEEVRKFKTPHRPYFTKFTINIARRELKVTICEKHTAAELEQELLLRGKIEDMNFKQSQQNARGNGGLSWKSMP